MLIASAGADACGASGGSMNDNRRVDITALVDGGRVGGFHILLFSLCALSLIMDGFDAQALGFVGPEIQSAFGLSRPEFGNLLAAGNFGLMLGALLFTVLGDRLGRRPVLVFGTLWYAVFSLLTARADTSNELLMLRFVGGLGLGAVIPNATALIGEYSPKRLRVTLIMGITVGYTVGAAFGGVVANWLVPQFGWPSVFYFGGIVPLIVGLLMIFWLPESLQFLVVRRKFARITAWIRRVAPEVEVGSDTEYLAAEQGRKGVPVYYLLAEGRAPVTLLYWLANFMNLLNLYFLAGLLPSILADAGWPTATARLVGTLLQVGGVVGTFGFAWLISRRGFTPMLTAGFALASVSIAMIGSPHVITALPALIVVVFITGWCVVGGQPGLNALAATYYPTDMRSTGIGWGLGWGRFGAIVGPMIGGQLGAGGQLAELSVRQIFLVFAIPAAISAVAMLFMHGILRTRGNAQDLGRLSG
jgi:AAHS family 4-hydroxybenzoate transporter-like MFS transporter